MLKGFSHYDCVVQCWALQLQNIICSKYLQHDPLKNYNFLTGWNMNIKLSKNFNDGTKKSIRNVLMDSKFFYPIKVCSKSNSDIWCITRTEFLKSKQKKFLFSKFFLAFIRLTNTGKNSWIIHTITSSKRINHTVNLLRFTWQTKWPKKLPKCLH